MPSSAHLSEISLWRDRSAMKFVIWLSIAQTVSWGAMFYGFAVFISPLSNEFQWEKTEITGAFTVSLLIVGVFSYAAGRILDYFGGRWLMTAASALGGILLFLAGHIDNLTNYYVIWVGLGLVMSATLYPSGFAVIIATLGSRARQGVTLMTLIAGFASTIFIPLISYSLTQLDWRATYYLLGLSLLLICVPIHAYVLKSERVPRNKKNDSLEFFQLGSQKGPIARNITNPRFLWIGLCFTTNSLVMAGVTVHIIPLMLERGFDMTTIVATIAIIGPMQVAGRLVMTIFANWLDFRKSGLLSCIALLASFGALSAATPENHFHYLFPILYGVSLGINTIVRALAVPELIGPEAYGALNGVLGFASAMALAAAPLIVSWIWSINSDYTIPLLILSLTALLSVCSFVLAVKKSIQTL